MIGYLNTLKKQECFGCGACFQACPKQAIEMREDREGFSYPLINLEKCISCNICHKICPTENMPGFNRVHNALVGYNSNPIVRRESASGGAFKSLIDVYDKDVNVFGATWAGRSCVIHAEATKEDAYRKFHKSKYIQSNTSYTYCQVKNQIKSGKKVIYVGTPCQIAGLRSFIGQSKPNLLCVDIVCHGVSSGKVLESYFETMDKKNSKVTGIDFRLKTKRNGEFNSKCALLYYEDGTRKVVDYDSSGFLRGFANGLFFRPSCAVCPFAKAERVSDLTIGDAWGVEKIKPDLNPHEGVSLIFANTEKGEKVLQIIRDRNHFFIEAEPDVLIAGNGRLLKPDVGHSKRKEFFERFEDENFEQLVQFCIPRISLMHKVGYRIKLFLRGKKYE